MSQLFKLSESEKLRIELDEKQQKQISNFYKQIATDVRKQAKTFKDRTNISSILKVQYLKQMEKKIKTAFVESEKKIGNIITKNMENIAKSVVSDNDKWMKKIGIPNGGALLNVPKDIIEKVITGNLYEGDWTLSKALWKDVKKKQKDINKVIAKGIAENKSAYDIAKDLEMYVDPKAQKPWDWSKVYPNTNKKIDYNAQRLARTMVSHAYQQSIVNTTKPNPFVEGLKWRATGGAKMCPICAGRDGTVYKKDELPLDHPNGMCTFIAVIMDDDAISTRLANWVKGGEDKELDKWSEVLGNKPEDKQQTIKTDIPKTTKQKEDFTEWIKQLKNNTVSSLEEMWNKVSVNLSKKQKEAITEYTSSSFTDINRFLRFNKPTSKNMKESIKNIKKGLGKNPLQESLIVRRGADYDALSGMLGTTEHLDFNSSDESLNKIIGAVMQDKGFFSTSPIATGGFTYKDIDFVIKCPEGTQGTYIAPISQFSNEKEFLINAGTSFIIKGYEKLANSLQIFLEVVV